MKFNVLCNGSSGGRLGLISAFSRNPELCFETPLICLATKTGSLPYLTSEVLDKVVSSSAILQVDLPSVFDMAESVLEFGQGLSKFLGLQRMFTYISINDSATVLPPGYNQASGISLWKRSGRLVLGVKEHIKTIEALKPDIFEILADTDTYSPNGIADKRSFKAVDRSLNYLEKSIELISVSEVLKDSPFFVHIAGGYNKKQREKSIAAARESNCSGYVLSGLSPTGPLLEGFNFSTTKDVITETIEALRTPWKVNVFPGPLSPYEVIDLVEAGIDVFDTSLPFVATERGCALVFCNRIATSKYSQNRDTTCPPEETPSSMPKDESIKNDISRGYEIDLNLQEFRDDFQPISSKCECYTCRKYSRAYINHLLTVKELLGPILLMMHNLHHYLKFFESIRRCLKEDCLSDLKTSVMNTI